MSSMHRLIPFPPEQMPSGLLCQVARLLQKELLIASNDLLDLFRSLFAVLKASFKGIGGTDKYFPI